MTNGQKFKLKDRNFSAHHWNTNVLDAVLAANT